jgi:sec-independent protein translocase protein TatA
LGVPELLIIGAVLIFLFGAKKLPDTARALGQSLRMFKRETAKMNDDDDAAVVKAQVQPATPPQPITSTATPSAEEQIRALQEENQRLKAAAEPTINGTPLSQAQKDQRSS